MAITTGNRIAAYHRKPPDKCASYLNSVAFFTSYLCVLLLYFWIPDRAEVWVKTNIHVMTGSDVGMGSAYRGLL